MNVASLELCKELYELSGWTKPKDDDEWHWESVTTEKWIAPKYDLGYLLRKLPSLPDPEFGEEESYYPHVVNLQTHSMAGYFDEDFSLWGEWTATALTPEDAACKLAIELWKQGILK